MKPVIAVTMGDPAGIGPEIAARTAVMPAIKRLCTPVIVGDRRLLSPFVSMKDLKKVPVIPVTIHGRIVPGRASRAAGMCALETIRQGARLCLNGSVHGMVTAPVNKQTASLSGAPFTGHTEFLARIANVKDPIMMMQAKDVRIVMVTRHVPLKKVSAVLSASLLRTSIKKAFYELRQTYRFNIKRAVVASVNPHAGASGDWGDEERKIILPVVRRLKKQGYPVSGPVPADAAWHHLMKGKYDLGFGMYHDQVMIPLKVTHASEMVNVTLGLPFVRTSPAHGTAYDIAGRGIADIRPMRSAIMVAVDLVRRKFQQSKSI